jgi:hypothetical protein
MSAAGHPSDLALDRGGPAVESHLAACDLCRARAASAREAMAVFQQRVYPATLASVTERAPGRRGRGAWRLWLGLPVVAAASVLLFVRARHVDEADSDRTTTAYVGTKGASGLFPPGIEIFVKRGGQVVVLEPGRKVRAGDALRFVYRGEEPQHLELRLVGADGASVLLHPASGVAPLMRPGDAMAGSAVVDDRPGAEEVLIGASAQPFDTTSPPPTLRHYRIRLEKE